MITDNLKNASLCENISPQIRRAFDYLRHTDFNAVSDGKHEIDGDRIFALVQQYTTKPKQDGKWEAHRKYIDIQYIIRGTEQIGYANSAKLAAGPYDQAKDIMFLAGDGNCLTLSAGDFMILFPEDAHMPSLAVTNPAEVRKAVVKIAVEQAGHHTGR